MKLALNWSGPNPVSSLAGRRVCSRIEFQPMYEFSLSQDNFAGRFD